MPVRASSRVGSALVEPPVHTMVKPVKDSAINCTPKIKPPRNLLRKEAVRSTNLHGVLSERRVAKGLGARLQPASGAMVHAKGDFYSVAGKEFLYEAKSTVNASIPLTLAHLVKISEEATAKGRSPALTISFVLPDGRPRPQASTDWVCLPMAVFQELLELSTHRD